ncbi:hypothetical protein HWV07_11125 [Natronomonas salina]|uniref:DUF7344 domain-containing protein n=1 Tax=Natronomonas salina TaxID=1710540 RepID=UPI0015B3DD5A|nr:hypothetical protein [Natronomonas salina]QLD89553.1 hypothetical protein HWV07_11125 [Natronomonas salina]
MSEGSTASHPVLDLSGHRYRRIILAALADEQRPLTVNDLTKAIIKHNDNISVMEIPEGRLSELQLLLHHVHLPKIESTRLITYNQDRGLVEPTEQLDRLQPQISTLIEADSAIESPVEL